MTRTVAVAIVGLFLTWESSAAQEHPDSVHRRNHCRLAVQVIETGHPAPRREWALDYIRLCGTEGGRALAQALRAARQVSDTAMLGRLTAPALHMIDGELFTSALAVAADETATTEARGFSFRVLIQSIDPGRSLGYADLTELPGAHSSCAGVGAGFHFQPRTGSPLPSDAPAQVLATAQRVAVSTAPLQVLRAARCTQAHAERILRRAPQ